MKHLTNWINSEETPPKHIGEYNASVLKQPTMFRWWDGKDWSVPYNDYFSEETKRKLRRRKDLRNKSPIFYRGLAIKPRIYNIHYLRPLS